MISSGRLDTCHKHEVAEEETDWEIEVDEIVNLAKELWSANREPENSVSYIYSYYDYSD